MLRAHVAAAVSLSLLAGCANDVIYEDSGRGDGSDSDGGASSVSSVDPSIAVTAGPAASGGSGGGGAGSGLALTGDVLDPDEVYLYGTLTEGSCEDGALAHWSAPNDAVVGFDCYFDGRTAEVRPTDGRLVYVDWDAPILREFVCDECPYSGTGIPEQPLANDPAYPLPECAELSEPDLLVSPEGAVFHTCVMDEGPWYDESGAMVLDASDSLLHVGHDGIALTANGELSNLETGASIPIAGWPSFAVDTVRAVAAPDAFLVVFDDPATADFGGQQLWKIDLAGIATLVGAFPPLPPEVPQVLPGLGKLDASGAFLQLAYGLETFEDVIVRREIGGASEVVYDEAFDPLVKVHISYLLSGP